MEKYKKFISKVNFLSFLALLATLPYPLPFIHFFWLVWIVTWLLEFRYLHKENIRIHRGMLYLSCGVVIWLLWNILSVSWADNTQAAWANILRYISLLTIPFVGFFGVNEYYDWRKCLKVLLVSSVISIGVYMFTHYWIMNYPYAINKHSDSKIIEIDWLHMNNLLLNIKHRMHFSNLLCILFPFLIIAHNKIGKLATILTSILLLIAIYMTGSRIALINLIMIATITICWFILRRKKIWVKGLGISMAIIIIILGSTIGMLLHPRNSGHSVTELISVDTDNTNAPAFEPRFAIWYTALEQPKDYLAYGLGSGNATDYLVKKYQEYGWERYIDRQFSPHNQFLSVCIDLGIVASVLFILFWLGIPFFFTGTQRYWALCIIGICMCSMMTDMLLGGLEGIVFISLMAILNSMLPTSDILEIRPQKKSID